MGCESINLHSCSEHALGKRLSGQAQPIPSEQGAGAGGAGAGEPAPGASAGAILTPGPGLDSRSGLQRQQ